MRPWLLLCLLAAGCSTGAAQTTGQQKRDAADASKIAKALAGLTPGQPQTCLSSIDRRIAQTSTYGSTVLFRIGGRRVYRNDMNGNCTSSSIDPIFVTQTPTSSLCRGDIVQLVDRVSRFPVGACSYGDFVPYTRAK